MKKNGKIIFILLFTLLFIIITIRKQNEFKKFNDNYILQVSENYAIQNEEIYNEEITSLQNEYNNQDVKATLEILNTDYKVPVVQSKDNKYYLRRLPNKEYNIMGSIFLDYRVNVDTSKKLLIFGHNDAKLDMPFKILESYYDQEFLNNHQYIVIKTKEKIRKYKIFTIFIEPTDYSYMDVDFSKSSYIDHLNKLKNKSMFTLDSKLDNETNILLLQTCSTHKDYRNYKKKYLIIGFIEIDENKDY